MADGSLVFDTKIDTSEFEKSVAEIKASAENIASNEIVQKVSVEFDDGNAAEKIKNLTDSLKDVAEDIAETADDAADNIKESTDDVAEDVKSTAKKAADAVEDAADASEKAVKDASDGMAGSAASAGEIIKGILGSQIVQKGLSELVSFGKKAVALASDLDEVQNVVDVTFGEGAETINQFAKNASSAFGLTELQAKQYSGTVGAMIKSMGLSDKAALDMSQSIVGLTGDIASFYNLDHDTAFQKIRSGLSGETEPLKSLGLNLSVNLRACMV